MSLSTHQVEGPWDQLPWIVQALITWNLGCSPQKQKSWANSKEFLCFSRLWKFTFTSPHWVNKKCWIRIRGITNGYWALFESPWVEKLKSSKRLSRQVEEHLWSGRQCGPMEYDDILLKDVQLMLLWSYNLILELQKSYQFGTSFLP